MIFRFCRKYSIWIVYSSVELCPLKIRPTQLQLEGRRLIQLQHGWIGGIGKPSINRIFEPTNKAPTQFTIISVTSYSREIPTQEHRVAKITCGTLTLIFIEQKRAIRNQHWRNDGWVRNVCADQKKTWTFEIF